MAQPEIKGKLKTLKTWGGQRETKGLDELLEAAYNSREKRLTGWKNSAGGASST